MPGKPQAEERAVSLDELKAGSSSRLHHEVFPQKLATDSDLAYVDVVADVVVPDTVKKGADLTVKVSLSNPSPGGDEECHQPRLPAADHRPQEEQRDRDRGGAGGGGGLNSPDAISAIRYAASREWPATR